MSRRRIMQSLDQRYELPDGYTRVNYLENNGKNILILAFQLMWEIAYLFPHLRLMQKITIQ